MICPQCLEEGKQSKVIIDNDYKKRKYIDFKTREPFVPKEHFMTEQYEIFYDEKGEWHKHPKYTDIQLLKCSNDHDVEITGTHTSPCCDQIKEEIKIIEDN